MNKRIVILLSGFLIFAITLVLFFIIFLGIPKYKSPNASLKLSVNVFDRNISVGEKIYNFYEINDKNADVFFEVDKTGIININNDKIEALAVGDVRVTLFAKNDIDSVKSEFSIKVLEKNYYLKFVAVENCLFNKSTNTILAKDNCFQFYMEFYDLNDKILENACYLITSDDKNTIIDRKIHNVIIITEKDITLFIEHEMFNTNLVLKVICDFERE